MKAIKYTHLILLFGLFACSPETPPPHLAKVGNQYITVDQFKNAYQFNPGPGAGKESYRAVLSALVAEKVCARQGIKKNIQSKRRIKLLIDQYEREAIIEKFWQDQVVEKITVSEDELKQAYVSSKKEKVIRYLIYDNKAAADADYGKLETGLSFEQLSELRNSFSMDTIRAEGRFENIEKAVFSTPLNSVSKPVKEGPLYFIIKVIKENKQLFTSEDEYQQKKGSLLKQLKEKKAQKQLQAYINKNKRAGGYELEKGLFKEIVKKMESDLFKGQNEQLDSPGAIDHFLTRVENDNADFFSKAAVQFSGGGQWTVKTLMERIIAGPYPLSFKSRGAFRQSMILAAKHTLDDQLIVDEGIRLGLGKTKYVNEQKQMWSDFLVAQELLTNDLKFTEKEDLENYLLQSAENYKIEIYPEILDTLKLNHSGLMTVKKHFPKRTAVPPVNRSLNLKKWQAMLFAGPHH